MPHLTLEYSANLSQKTDIGSLTGRLLDAALGTGLFEEGAIRVRAIECAHYAIADRHPENAFLDISLRIGEGRSAADKASAGAAIYAAATQYLEPLFAAPHFALSFEIREIDAALSWKTNAIHTRLRAQ